MAIKKEIDIVLNADQAILEANRLETALEGVDNESGKVKESVGSVADNGGAIAILDSLTGGLATQLKDAYEASKLFNFSLKATRGALIATGIGAFVVALGLVVTYWDDIVEFIGGANKQLQKQIDLGIDVSKGLDDQLAILEIQKTTLENLGKSTAKIEKDIKLTLENQLLQAEANLKLLNSQLEIESSKARELSIWQKIQIAAGGTLGTAQIISEEEKERNKEQRAAVQEQLISIENIRLKQSEAIKQEREEYLSFKAEKDARPNVGTVGGGLSSEGFGGNIAEDPEIIFEQGKADRLKEIDDELTEFLIENAKRKLLQDEVIANARIGLEENTLALLFNIAKEGSAISKAVAIADVVREQVRSVSGIISNTGIANAKAVAASPLTGGQPWVTLNTVGAGLGIAASIAGAGRAIKDITAGKSSLGGGGGFGGGIGSGGASAPSFNLVEGSGSNQIAEGLRNSKDPIKAYVVSGDVTTSQELDRNIQGDASLG